MMNISQHRASTLSELDEFCRICLLRKPQLRPLASQYSAVVMIPEMLYKVTGALLNLQEQLPRMICERCLAKLDLAYSISEEFREQEEVLRSFWFKGKPLVDQLVEYQRGEESRRKLYSEGIIERLAGSPVLRSGDEEVQHQSLANLNGMVQPRSVQPDVPSQKPLDTPEVCIEILSDDSDDEALAVHRKPSKEPTSDPELEMVLELDDVQTSGVLPSDVKLEMPEESPVESEDEQDDADDDSDYVPDEIIEDRVDKDSTNVRKSSFKCKLCPRSFLYEYRLRVHEIQHKTNGTVRQLYKDKQSVPRSSSSRKSRQNQPEKKKVDVNPSLLSKQNKKEGIVQCKLCPRIYSTLSYLIKHMKVDHDQEMTEPIEDLGRTRPYKCTQCTVSFNTEERLGVHVQKLHTGYQCKKCNRVFPYKAGLQRHERSFDSMCPLLIVRDGKTFYKCRQCSKIYVCKNNYICHARSHNTTTPEALQCPDCGKRFYQRANLRIHQQQVHNSFVKEEEAEVGSPAVETAVPDAGTTVLHCVECDTLFQTQESYEAHLREHQSHVQVEGSFGPVQEETNEMVVDQTSVLPITQKEHNPSYSNEVALEESSPMQQQTQPDMVVLASDNASDSNESSKQLPSTSSSSVDVDLAIGRDNCHICGALFKNKWITTIQKHMLSHENLTKEKYKCEVCNEIFDFNFKLQQHRQLVHQLPFEDEVICEKCYRPVKTINYERHLVYHRNVEQRLFLCELCDIAFSSNSQLKSHVSRCQIAHRASSPPRTPVVQAASPVLEDEQSRVEREGRFKCTECGKRFKSWESIVSHTSMHRAIREGLYKCQVCRAHCPSNSDLENHMKQEHPQHQVEQLPSATDQNSDQQQPMEKD